MTERQVSCNDEDRQNPEDFGTRRLSLIRIYTATPGSTGSSVTLVRTLTSWVVVDSGGASDRDGIAKGFSDNCAPLEKVNVLLSTRLDQRTSANDDLFPHALHHLKRSDWGNVKGPNQRRVVINTPFHWIDKYMKIVKVVDQGGDGLVLLVHFPRTPELLDPASRELAGKIVGIMGNAFFSATEPANAALLGEARRKRAVGGPRPDNPSDIPSILLYCDMVIPGQGDPIVLNP